MTTLPPIEELERIGNAATPPPWEVGRDDDCVTIESDYCGFVIYDEFLQLNDAEFIATARNHWSGMLAEIKRLREIEADLRKRLIRADPLCENMHHRPSEYHEAGQPCPVEAWVRNGIEELQ